MKLVQIFHQLMVITVAEDGPNFFLVELFVHSLEIKVLYKSSYHTGFLKMKTKLKLAKTTW